MSAARGRAYLDSIHGFLAPRLHTLINSSVGIDEPDFVNSNMFVYPNPIVSADLLLDIGKQEEAQTLVIEKRTEINSAYSGGLANLAKKMLDKSLWLGATVCYRALLNDILSSGSKRSYKYGHIYYQRLREIDQNIEDYTPIDNHDQYEQWLQNRHGRKYNFWSNTDSTR